MVLTIEELGVALEGSLHASKPLREEAEQRIHQWMSQEGKRETQREYLDCIDLFS